jgi:ABC-2 type transport system ATP-binding protein
MFIEKRRSFCWLSVPFFSYTPRQVLMSEQPMIEVVDLTKRYTGRTAVDGISFTVARGEIVGLLGPNGAGKSTTMRVLSSFMPATSGTVRVAGFDVFHQSEEVRRRIGFMPENNPLYPEMRVREYLKFRARLKGLGWKKSRERVTTVMEQCGLADVGRRIIGQLSKGYKQRVGLADALVHEPDLIILDEPTIGLDPNQIRSVRQLIKSLAEKHTVLISTHILPEAEMMCSRMLIMYDGKILAADTPENLQKLMQGSSQIVAELDAPADELRGVFAQMPGIEQFDVSAAEGEFQRCVLTPRDGYDLRPAIFMLARERGWVLRELTRSRHSLEDIYVQVTKPKEEEEN